MTDFPLLPPSEVWFYISLNITLLPAAFVVMWAVVECN